MDLYLYTLKQYAIFSGRASRTELWTFLIANVVIKIILVIISVKMGLYITDNPEEDRTLLDGLFAIAVFIPTIAVSVRRIHDIGLSGWWGWIFIPLVIPMIIVSFIPSKDNDEYGENPKYSTNLNSKSGNLATLIIVLILLVIGLAINLQNNSGATQTQTVAKVDNTEWQIKTIRAKKRLTLLCDNGNYEACDDVASIWKTGGNDIVDYNKALKFYKKACDGNIIMSCISFGHMHEKGYGVNIDLVKAKEIYEQVCYGYEGDGSFNSLGCRKAGYLYEDEPFNDLSKAIKFYRRACEELESRDGCKDYNKLRAKGY